MLKPSVDWSMFKNTRTIRAAGTIITISSSIHQILSSALDLMQLHQGKKHNFLKSICFSLLSTHPPLVKVEINVLQIDPLHKIVRCFYACHAALLRDFRLQIPISTRKEQKHATSKYKKESQHYECRIHSLCSQ